MVDVFREHAHLNGTTVVYGVEGQSNNFRTVGELISRVQMMEVRG